jgi:hypothetical protein
MVRLILIASALALTFLQPVGANSAQIIGSVAADTYVQYNTPNTNYGSDPTLKVGHHGDEWAALINFNLPSLPTGATITGATMNLYWNGSTGAGQFMLPYWIPWFDVHKVNTSWAETSVTFSDIFQSSLNQTWPYLPIVKNGFFDSAVLADYSITDPNLESGRWINLDITGQVALWYGGQQNNGLILTSRGWIFNSFFFASKETYMPPTLTVTYTAPSSVPLPGALWLFGPGLAGIGILRKKFKG